ncbi:hypothetical protein AB1N83_011388 [Pleurotus pulmonarius]
MNDLEFCRNKKAHRRLQPPFDFHIQGQAVGNMDPDMTPRTSKLIVGLERLNMLTPLSSLGVGLAGRPCLLSRSALTVMTMTPLSCGGGKRCPGPVLRHVQFGSIIPGLSLSGLQPTEMLFWFPSHVEGRDREADGCPTASATPPGMMASLLP